MEAREATRTLEPLNENGDELEGENGEASFRHVQDRGCYGDETPNAYLNRAQEYADALAAIGEPVKDKDLVMLVVSVGSPKACQKLVNAQLSELMLKIELLLDLSLTHHTIWSTSLFMVLVQTTTTTTGVTITTTVAIATTLVVTTTEVVLASANFANTRAQSSNASANWHSDTGTNSHVTPDLQQWTLRRHIMVMTHFMLAMDESTHTTLLTGPSKHGLYTITLPQLKSINKVSFSAVRASPTIWHRRLGHPHQHLLRYMLSNISLPVTNKSLSSFCNSCPLWKSSKLPLFESGFRTQKSDVYSTFKSFVQMVERQFTTKLKNVQTDWGGEFRNLASFFSSLGIIHRRSCSHTSEQNGFVERRNPPRCGGTVLILLYLAQSMLFLNVFWHYAFDNVVYLINRMPSRTSTNKSPFEHIFKRSPDYSFLRVFGCLCFPHLRPYNRHKMDFHSTPCVFLGYSPSHHGYRCLDISTERLYIAQHVRHVSGILLSQKKYILELLQSAGLSNPQIRVFSHGLPRAHSV
ncbi:putative RNA-directed DNA polymerase [Tanacetum coccineum]